MSCEATLYDEVNRQYQHPTNHRRARDLIRRGHYLGVYKNMKGDDDDDEVVMNNTALTLLIAMIPDIFTDARYDTVEFKQTTLALLQSGRSNPGQYIEHVEGSETALLRLLTEFLAVERRGPPHDPEQTKYIVDVGLAIVATGEHNPGCPDRDQNTALVLACQHPTLEPIAVALLLHEQGSSYHSSTDQQTTALAHAHTHHMKKVMALFRTLAHRTQAMSRIPASAAFVPWAHTRRAKHLPRDVQQQVGQFLGRGGGRRQRRTRRRGMQHGRVKMI